MKRPLTARVPCDPAAFRVGESETDTRAALVALHEIRAGRAPVVALAGGASKALRFPADTHLTFAELVGAAAPTDDAAEAVWTIGAAEPAEQSRRRFVWSTSDIACTDEVTTDDLVWTVKRLAHIASELRKNLDVHVGDIDVLSDDEAQAVQSKAKGARVPLEKVRVLELVLANAKREPSRVAIVDAARTWTYGELAARSRGFAIELAKRNVAQGDCVAIAMPRSGDVVAAILGVFWCGAAYVFLDPDYPVARRALMLADTGAKTVIATNDVAWSSTPTSIVVPAEALPEGNDWRTAKPAHGDLAYVVYTSGSTGTPKGVRVPHLGIAKELEGMRRAVELDEDDVVVALASPSFDVSVSELLVPLALGACVHVIPAHDILDGPRLRAHFERIRPTVAGLIRHVCDSLIAAGWEGDPNLRVWFGGEPARPDLARRVASMNRALYNCYGPTEASITTTVHRVAPNQTEPIPIGRPLANVDVYVLDDQRRVQPFGFIGELHVGGAGVADGYHGQVELTAERFPTIPLGGGAVRVYRTGDLVSMRANGELDFIGRRDDQVKLRGFRIELGEVASAVCSVPGVRDALAVVRDDALVAYVLLDDGALAAQEFVAVRRRVAEQLPRFMLPQRYVALERWPLNSNNKVDLAKLPSPDAPVAAGSVSEAAAKDKAALGADEVREIVKVALKLASLGDDDDFLDLGASSLELVRLATALRGRGVTTSVAELYEHATLRAVLALTRDAVSGHPETNLNATGRVATPRQDPAMPTTPAGLVDRVGQTPVPVAEAEHRGIGDGIDGGRRHPLSSAVAFILLKSLMGSTTIIWTLCCDFSKHPSVDRLRAAWSSVMRDSAILRTRFDLEGDVPEAVVERDVAPRFTTWDESQIPLAGFKERVRSIERMRREEPFDVAKFPYAGLDLILGPGGQATVLFSYAVMLLDLAALNEILQDLWRRYEGEGGPLYRRDSLFGGVESETVALDASTAAFLRETFEGVTKPTRLPLDAMDATVVGISNSVIRAGYHFHSLSTFARTPAARKLLAAAGAGSTRKQRPTLRGIRDLLNVLSSAVPAQESAFASTGLRDQVRRRARELRVSEQSCFVTALGILLARWTRAPYAIIRVIAHPDSGGGGRGTRDLPVCVRVEKGATIGETLRRTNVAIGRMLEIPSRTAILDALPFGEPITDAIYVAGELPNVAPPAAMAPGEVRAEERSDPLFALSVGWGRSEFTFRWDTTRIRSTTARLRLAEYMRVLQALTVLDVEARVDTLPA